MSKILTNSLPQLWLFSSRSKPKLKLNSTNKSQLSIKLLHCSQLFALTLSLPTLPLSLSIGPSALAFSRRSAVCVLWALLASSRMLHSLFTILSKLPRNSNNSSNATTTTMLLFMAMLSKATTTLLSTNALTLKKKSIVTRLSWTMLPLWWSTTTMAHSKPNMAQVATWLLMSNANGAQMLSSL